jgi:hypothetical protein
VHAKPPGPPVTVIQAVDPAGALARYLGDLSVAVGRVPAGRGGTVSVDVLGRGAPPLLRGPDSRPPGGAVLITDPRRMSPFVIELLKDPHVAVARTGVLRSRPAPGAVMAGWSGATAGSAPSWAARPSRPASTPVTCRDGRRAPVRLPEDRTDLTGFKAGETGQRLGADEAGAPLSVRQRRQPLGCQPKSHDLSWRRWFRILRSRSACSSCQPGRPAVGRLPGSGAGPRGDDYRGRGGDTGVEGGGCCYRQGAYWC